MFFQKLLFVMKKSSKSFYYTFELFKIVRESVSVTLRKENQKR